MTHTPSSPTPHQGPQQGPQPGFQPPPYPGSAVPTPSPRKPWFKRWWIWAIIVVVLLGFINAIGGGGEPADDAPATTPSAATAPSADTEESAAPAEEPAEEPKADLTLDDGWTMDDSDGFAVYVEGYVSNNTDKDITNYVQITFDALDADGANLDSCIDNTNTIDAGGKWKFKAVCLSNADEIAEVRFKDLTGF